MNKGIKITLGVIAAIIILSFAFGGGAEDAMIKGGNDFQHKIENEVAKDAETQYNIVVKGGDEMESYVQAGMVAAAYLQAEDEKNYKKWKAIEAKHKKKAGVDF